MDKSEVYQSAKKRVEAKMGFYTHLSAHYLGCISPDNRERGVIDWLSHTPMEFESMGAIYDQSPP